MALPEERMRVTAADRMATERGAGSAAAAIYGSRVSWSGVWSGVMIGLGALLLLSVLGLAIGISAADVGPGADTSGQGLGVATGIWGGLSLLLSLFVGGMVAARTGMVTDRTAAMFQGSLVWVLAVLGLIYLATSGVALATSALFGAVGGITRGVGTAVGSAANLSELTTGDVDQILARLDNPGTVNLVAGATGMSSSEARSALSDLHARIEAVRDDPARALAEARQGVERLAARAGQRVQEAAAAAQPYATATTWITFAALVLSLAAAIGGALWGSARATAQLVGAR